MGNAAELPKRRLGRTEAFVSLVGMGGFHLGRPELAEKDAIALIHAGVDRGITFLDNCWDYNGGASEIRMGRALAAAGYRDRVFLMTKIDGRTRAAASKQIDESLARLQTDRVDLLQFHENIRPNDADRIFTEGGIEAALEAQRAGKIRFIGFTGHKRPKYHLHMIDVARAHGFTFDTVQMPLNVMDAHFESFERAVVPVALALDMGILGMKPLGDHHIVDTGAVAPIDLLHYAMNLPTSVVITGIDSAAALDQALEAALTFEPLPESKVQSILAATATLARDGATERYKTTDAHDSTDSNPDWLG